MSAKHTPGPWRWDQEATVTTGQIYSDTGHDNHGPMLVAQTRGWGYLTGRGGGLAMDPGEAVKIQDANARLIAAAPDLLAALEALEWVQAVDNLPIEACGLCRRMRGVGHAKNCIIGTAIRAARGEVTSDGE